MNKDHEAEWSMPKHLGDIHFLHAPMPCHAMQHHPVAMIVLLMCSPHPWPANSTCMLSHVISQDVAQLLSGELGHPA